MDWLSSWINGSKRVWLKTSSFLVWFETWRVAPKQFLTKSNGEGARNALSLGGTMLGYYPVRVLPSKTAIAPVNPTYLPQGFEKKLQLVGVGYRATVEGKELVEKVGFSHPDKMTIPNDLKVKVEDNTRITVSRYDKSNIGQFAATIRKWRPLEPYKGKEVNYADEIIRRRNVSTGQRTKKMNQ